MADNDQMFEQTPSNEDMEQWLSSLTDDQELDLPALMVGKPFPISGEEGDDDDSTDDEGGDDDATGDDDQEIEEGGEESKGDDDDTITVNGKQFARADIERLYAFDQHLRANPDVAQRVNAALAPPTAPAGEASVPPATTPASKDFEPPAVPENIDLDDPAMKFLWDQHVNTQKQLWERDQRDQQIIAQQANFQQTQIQRQAQDDMNTALGQFQTKFPNLNDEDVKKIRDAAVPFVGGLLQQMGKGNEARALYRSMEVAAYADNDLRQKLEEPEKPNPTSHRRNQSRKRKLGEISGTPRSAPRTESRPVFRSDRDMVNEFAQALADEGLGR